jgi:phosphopentomutase
MIKRAILIVLDSVGVGELPDAAKYGDQGSNTLGHVAEKVGGLYLPNLERLGLGRIIPVRGVSDKIEPTACFGKMAEHSPGKDTTTGHWEIAGLWLEEPFPTYPNGFPKEIIHPFEKQIGRKVLGNKPASGTEIIKELGKKHLATGRPIVYTSADSVFQIAAHQRIIPLEQLYEFCRIARKLLTGSHAVDRVIARPFIGEPGNFQRTEWRKDFSLPPPTPTLLDYAQKAGIKVKAIGKISEIFSGQGISSSVHTRNNLKAIYQIIKHLQAANGRQIIFANLVDFDMLWGHRNNYQAYARGLEEFDRHLPEIISLVRDEDLLIITADHGCDPTTPSTDHSREYVPLLLYSSKIRSGVNLGSRSTFADLGKTISEAMGFQAPIKGESFWLKVIRGVQ